MYAEARSRNEQDALSMTSGKIMESVSTFNKIVSVVVERYKKDPAPGSRNGFKFFVSRDLTIAQLASIIKRRMRISQNHPFQLFSSNGRPAVMMTQHLSEISSVFKNKKGALHFICAAENTFGCPVPNSKSIKPRFPGNEPNPFGAPEPTSEDENTFFAQMVPEDDDMLPLTDEEVILLEQVIPQGGPMQMTTTEIPVPFLTTSPNNIPLEMDTLLEAAEHAFASSSNPSEATWSGTPSPELLTSLIDTLDGLVQTRFIFIHPQTPPPTTAIVPGSSDYNAFVTAVEQLVQALDGYNIGMALNPSASNVPLTGTALLTQELFNTEPELHQVLTAHNDAKMQAQLLANDLLQSLQSPALPSPADNTGSTQPHILVQYFSEIKRILAFRALLNQTLMNGYMNTDVTEIEIWSEFEGSPMVTESSQESSQFVL